MASPVVRVFLYSPEGKSKKFHGDPKSYSEMISSVDTSIGTWYYGHHTEMPLPPRSEGWVVDCHGVWDDDEIRGVIESTITPLSVLSYVSSNGRNAQAALQLCVTTKTPLVLVYQHEHKSVVMSYLRNKGKKVIGLVDDREVNLEPLSLLGFRSILVNFNEKKKSGCRFAIASHADELRSLLLEVVSKNPQRRSNNASNRNVNNRNNQNNNNNNILVDNDNEIEPQPNSSNCFGRCGCCETLHKEVAELKELVINLQNSINNLQK